MVESMFSVLLKMSITASAAALLIIIFRLILGNRLPRVFSYALWAIVLVRLLIPFSITSAFSVFNLIPAPQVSTTQDLQYNRPLKDFSNFKASRRLKTAVLFKNDDLINECSRKLKLKRIVPIYISDRINTPVVCDFIKPRIVLPVDVAEYSDESELKHIITHELVHIKRFDYILKPLSMLALCVYWFNPILWVGFILAQRDMEMSCDEKVMSLWDGDIRKEYATSLIKLAEKQNVLLDGGLLAFGESNIKTRINGIMKFKKYGILSTAISVTILIVIGAVLLTNGLNNTAEKEWKVTESIYQDGINGCFSSSVTNEKKEKMQRSIELMKYMYPGSLLWKVIYCSGEKIILYNYSYILACDISKENRGIYSIIELDGLKVGDNTGPEIAMIYPAPDSMSCIVGTHGVDMGFGLREDKSLYFCNFYDDSVIEMEENINMPNAGVNSRFAGVKWYENNSSSSIIPWYVSISGNSSVINWDAAKGQKLDSIPKGAVIRTVEGRHLDNTDLETGYFNYSWWKKDENTMIGAPYKKGVSFESGLRLTDFEIVEVNPEDRTIKKLFSITK